MIKMLNQRTNKITRTSYVDVSSFSSSLSCRLCNIYFFYLCLTSINRNYTCVFFFFSFLSTRVQNKLQFLLHVSLVHLGQVFLESGPWQFAEAAEFAWNRLRCRYHASAVQQSSHLTETDEDIFHCTAAECLMRVYPCEENLSRSLLSLQKVCRREKRQRGGVRHVGVSLKERWCHCWISISALFVKVCFNCVE